MAVARNSKSIALSQGEFTFLNNADYTLDFSGNGVKIKQDGGQNTNITDAQFASATTFDAANLDELNIKGISFVTADAASDGKFEVDTNLDALIKELIAEKGVAGTIDSLTVNGGKADAFKLIWDHLDDNYSYYNTPVNETFIDLGIAYANYLKNGGERLDDTIVKFAPDGDDADTLPERSQSLHDNLLGNFDEASIADKFGAGADAILDRIEDAGLGALIGERGDWTDGRKYYGGYDHEDATATRAFDDVYFG